MLVHLEVVVISPRDIVRYDRKHKRQEVLLANVLICRKPKVKRDVVHPVVAYKHHDRIFEALVHLNAR